MLVAGPGVRPVALGERETLADVGATVAEYFGVTLGEGTSFLQALADHQLIAILKDVERQRHTGKEHGVQGKKG